MPLYRVAPAAVHSDAADQGPLPVACRCCPGGVSPSRRRRCYPSDMSDREQSVCEPLLPHPAWPAGKSGRPSRYCLRDVVDGIRYLTHNGPVWRAHHETYVYWAMIIVMTRRLAEKPNPASAPAEPQATLVFRAGSQMIDRSR